MRHRAGIATAAVVALGVLVTSCSESGQPAKSPPSAPSAGVPSVVGLPASSDGCAGQPPIGPLPTWARAGFQPPSAAVPHVLGSAGNIVAILWQPANALHSPPLPDVNNKILWVSRVPGTGPLVIRASLAGSTRTATVSVPGGPGPSYVDLPAPGCWTLHLSWAGHTDQLRLRYVA